MVLVKEPFPDTQREGEIQVGYNRTAVLLSGGSQRHRTI